MTRRQFLPAAGLGGLSAASAWAAEASRIRITGYEVYQVYVNTRPWTLFQLQTDAGLTGLGEATYTNRNADVALRYARELFETIRGRGIFEIERLRQAALPAVHGAPRNEKRAHGVAFSGFEQAMWDLQGKALGVPCYELFGGKLRDEIRI